MKILYIIILTTLSFLNLSCQEQDYFKITEKPFISINNINQKSISLNISPLNKKDNILITISKDEDAAKNINQINTLTKADTLDFNALSKANDNQYIILNSKLDTNYNLFINNLEELKKYYITLYTKVKNNYEIHQKLNFSTVVSSPEKNSKNITFSEITENSMHITFQAGNGEGRVVIMRKDIAPELPIDGIEYKYNTKFSSDSTLIKNNTYVVYKTNIAADNNFTVNGLKPGKYYVAVVEYNGKENHINYLGEFNGNIRSKNTSVGTPIALPGEVIDETNFVAKWEKETGVQYYLLDIAEDDKFVNIVFPFEGVDVGDSNMIEIELPFNLEKKAIYYRVRAFVNGTITNNSNIIKVEKKSNK